MRSRPPVKNLLLVLVDLGPARAKQTVPTGFSPAGVGAGAGLPSFDEPATPVMATATVALLMRLAPSAISLAHSSLTEPCSSMVACLTPSTLTLRSFE